MRIPPYRTTAAASYLAAITVAGLAGFAVTAVSLRTVQLVAGIALVLIALRADDEAETIPRVLRPASVAFGSLAVSSVSTARLSDAEYNDYFVMWLLQVVGFTVALVLSRSLGGSAASNTKYVSPAVLAGYSRWFFYAFLLAAIAYFFTQGIPILGANVEQTRIDAAQGGTGYIRVFAFLMPTIVILLVALRRRKAWLYALISVAFMVGVGNRIPLVYFLFPLAAMAALADRRIGSVKLIGTGLALLILVGAFGAYRVTTQDELQRHPDYRVALAEKDYVGVGVAAVDHYVQTIPQNAILVKRLVDEGAIPLQYGQTYGTLFVSALPGRQVSPDMRIKEASGKMFIGGGIPPTLAGEGYMNFGHFGIVFNAFALMFLLRFWASRVVQAASHPDRTQFRVVAAIYGYVLTWCVLAQVSGFAGSATVSLAGFLLLVGLRHLSTRTTAAPSPAPNGSRRSVSRTA